MMLHNRKKDLGLVMLVGDLSLRSALVKWGGSFSHLGPISWPGQLMASVKKLHVFSLRVALALFRSERTFQMCSMYRSGVLLNITILSR